MGRANRMLLRVASFGALGGFLFGYDLALIGGALLYMEEDLFLTELEIELIVGGAKFGAVFGTFIGGALMSCYGRRNAIVVDGLFYIVGPLLMAVSGSVLGLVVGRLVVGVGVGISAVVVPTYVAEMAPANSRGAMVTIYELMLCLGMLCASLMDFALKDWPGNWRWMVGVPALPAVLLLTTRWLLPESPRWLVHHGYMRKALAAIHSLRSDTRQSFLDSSCAEVEDELLELWSSVEMELEAMWTPHSSLPNPLSTCSVQWWNSFLVYFCGRDAHDDPEQPLRPSNVVDRRA
ncbi:hypothetical protein CYMTET_28978 [Cymbomonas tetramitiformis]|uniref:Major facilitator superfamily (MFS) profile domain-containing protein n=1 Tax=Cymbomonas tetramitiformis TaxID=36881 RepID=A0AAE0FLW1_9CHLO|nr:hypothetical protein CYMTET_28978 [Cymbomonas tetramitiformis]